MGATKRKSERGTVGFQKQGLQGCKRAAFKDKLKHLKIFKSLFVQKQIQMSAKLEVIRSTPPTEARAKSRSKERKLLIGYSLKPS